MPNIRDQVNAKKVEKAKKIAPKATSVVSGKLDDKQKVQVLAKKFMKLKGK